MIPEAEAWVGLHAMRRVFNIANLHGEATLLASYRMLLEEGKHAVINGVCTELVRRPRHVQLLLQHAEGQRRERFVDGALPAAATRICHQQALRVEEVRCSERLCTHRGVSVCAAQQESLHRRTSKMRSEVAVSIASLRSDRYAALRGSGVSGRTSVGT